MALQPGIRLGPYEIPAASKSGLRYGQRAHQSSVEIDTLEQAVREEPNGTAPRTSSQA